MIIIHPRLVSPRYKRFSIEEKKKRWEGDPRRSQNVPASPGVDDTKLSFFFVKTYQHWNKLVLYGDADGRADFVVLT